MAVAKRQTKKGKILQKGNKGKIHGQEWEPQVKQACPLPD